MKKTLVITLLLSLIISGCSINKDIKKEDEITTSEKQEPLEVEDSLVKEDKGEDEILNYIVKGGSNIDEIKNLIDLGADVNHVIDEDEFKDKYLELAYEESINLLGATPLYVLMSENLSSNYEELGKVLMDSGADINHINPYNGLSILDMVIMNGSYLDKEKVLNDKLGRTKFLVLNGININRMSSKTPPALYLAALFKENEIYEFLIDSGADESFTNEEGQTAKDIKGIKDKAEEIAGNKIDTSVESEQSLKKMETQKEKLGETLEGLSDELHEGATDIGGYNKQEEKIWKYCVDRWNHYDKLEGGYAGDKYTKNVFEDAGKAYNITSKEAERIWNKVDRAKLGIN